MNIEKFTSIKNLANLFMKKIANDLSLSTPINPGVLRHIVGQSSMDRNFFFNEIRKDYSSDDFELFKTFIYGVGDFKFSFNENKMNSFDHSNCHTVYDVIQSYQTELSIKDVDFTTVWVSFLDGKIRKPLIFSTLPAFLLHEVSKISQQAEKEIIEFFNKKSPKDNSVITRQMFHDYHQNILFELQNEFNHSIANINDTFALKIAQNFKHEKTLFVEKGLNYRTYIFPNTELQHLISINSFYNDLDYFNVLSVDDLFEAVIKESDNISKSVKKSFNDLFKFHKDCLDKELANTRKSTYLLITPENNND